MPTRPKPKTGRPPIRDKRAEQRTAVRLDIEVRDALNAVASEHRISGSVLHDMIMEHVMGTDPERYVERLREFANKNLTF